LKNSMVEGGVVSRCPKPKRLKAKTPEYAPKRIKCCKNIKGHAWHAELRYALEYLFWYMEVFQPQMGAFLYAGEL
jgi:hypothetical protein